MPDSSKRIQALESALRGLMIEDGCWCEVAIDNPMYHGEHTAACITAQEVLDGNRTTDHAE